MTEKMPPLGERSPILRRAMWVGGFALIAVVVVAAFFLGGSLRGGGGDGGDESSAGPTEGSPTPAETVSVEEALTQYVTEQLGQEYIGDCTTSLMPREEGKLCSAARGERANKKAFLLGPSSYEFTLWVFLSKEGDAWKVDGTAEVKADTANIPGAPWPLEVGAQVVVAGTGNCLNVRAAAGTAQQAVDCLADGTLVTLAEGPVEADGYQWWRLQDRSGWVAGDWLRYPDESGTPTPEAPSPTPEP